jgi:membrane-associated phospholipid phosphatase
MAGAVCTSRLILKVHTLREVYSGFLIGILSLITAFVILD